MWPHRKGKAASRPSCCINVADCIKSDPKSGRARWGEKRGIWGFNDDRSSDGRHRGAANTGRRSAPLHPTGLGVVSLAGTPRQSDHYLIGSGAQMDLIDWTMWDLALIVMPAGAANDNEEKFRKPMLPVRPLP